MLGCCFEPVVIDPSAANDPKLALRALAGAARTYLERLENAVAAKEFPPRCALVTRVRGTGPGVSFGSLVAAVESGFPLSWSCPFEGSHNVSGAALTLEDALEERRDDGFLFLKFKPGTRDLPLHIHPHSDRFIFVIGGRGFYHLSDLPLQSLSRAAVRHLPARDRDALMFRRGVVHTFSTTEHPLMLLSYHRPYIELEDQDQYTCSDPPLTAAEFVSASASQVSFDAAWTVVG